MSNQYYFFGTRTTFIQAAPKIFRRVNGALEIGRSSRPLLRRDRYKLNMCRSRMTPKSLAEAERLRGLQRKVTVGVEGNPLSAAWF